MQGSDRPAPRSRRARGRRGAMLTLTSTARSSTRRSRLQAHSSTGTATPRSHRAGTARRRTVGRLDITPFTPENIRGHGEWGRTTERRIETPSARCVESNRPKLAERDSPGRRQDKTSTHLGRTPTFSPAPIGRHASATLTEGDADRDVEVDSSTLKVNQHRAVDVRDRRATSFRGAHTRAANTSGAVSVHGRGHAVRPRVMRARCR